MSQEKVDRYKQEKANRKKTMAREKLKKKLYILAGVLVTAAFVVWIGWSVYAEKKAAEDESRQMSELQAQLEEYLATATATENATTGNATTTGTGDKTTGADDKTTGADDKATSEGEEASSEEETTKAADDLKKE